MNLLDPILHSRLFWEMFFQASADCRSCPSLARADRHRLRRGERLTVTFPFPDNYTLYWTLDGGENPLELSHVDEDLIHFRQTRLAWLECHHMSDFFRWEEFQAVVSSLAAHDRDRAPWVPALLFSPYVAVTRDCAEAFVAHLGRSLRASDLFTAEEIRFLCEQAGRTVRPTLRWVEDPALGWLAEDEQGREPWYAFCSMRTRRIAENFGPETFDFGLVRDFFRALVPAED